MLTTPEQLTAATKSVFESQMSLMSALTHKAFESVEKLVELNLTVTRAAMDESSQTIKTLAAARSPQEFFSLSTVQAKPTSEKALAYARSVAGIASEIQAELTRITQTQIADTNLKIATLVEDVRRSAPSDPESMAAMFKSAVDRASAGYQKAMPVSVPAKGKADSPEDEAVVVEVTVAEKKAGRPAAKK